MPASSPTSSHRPLETILGQASAKQCLTAALSGNRMHHAWIYHGPPGIGKATTARALAHLLLCHNRSATTEVCGHCPACRPLCDPTAQHPDLHWIDKRLAATSGIAELRRKKQSNIPIDLLREQMIGGWIGSGASRRYFEPIIGTKPTLDHGKIFIIDQADQLGIEGQNALLKTLEEPPANTFIFLITAHEDRLLPTLRSRCQRTGFEPLTESAMRQWLTTHHPDLDDTEINALLTLAEGAPGQAQQAITYDLHHWYQPIHTHLHSAWQGTADPIWGAAMFELVEGYAKAQIAKETNASKDAANKIGVRQMLQLLARLCRQQLQTTPTKTADQPANQIIRHVRPALIGIDLIQKAEEQLMTNVAPALLLDNLALQWSTACLPPQVAAGRK